MIRKIFWAIAVPVLLSWTLDEAALAQSKCCAAGQHIPQAELGLGEQPKSGADFGTYQQYCSSFFSGENYDKCIKGYQARKISKQPLVRTPTTAGVAKPSNPPPQGKSGLTTTTTPNVNPALTSSGPLGGGAAAAATAGSKGKLLPTSGGTSAK
jgi:hypothetical protein